MALIAFEPKSPNEKVKESGKYIGIPPFDAPVAVYIHWPFCVSKCPYCDFNSHVREGIDLTLWREALLTDLAYEASITPGKTIGSIFFGGGTPSLMPPALVADLIDAAARHWPLASDVEITLEANPNSVEVDRFADLARAGVNRVSIGVQSFEPDVLHFLGRAHDRQEACRAIDVAQAHFKRVNFDLIYALPGQSADEWDKLLNYGLSFGTGHLSLYQLTIEPGTRFETMVRQGKFTPTDPDHAADLYDQTQTRMNEAGLPAYETSNHARAGEESRHNLTYWRYGDYLGIGPGAHGRRNDPHGTSCATQRHRKPENWLEAIGRNGHGLQSEQPLLPEERAREALMMGLRLAEGVDLEALEYRMQRPVSAMVDEEALVRLSSHGLILRDGNRLRVTAAGTLLLDAILGEIVR